MKTYIIDSIHHIIEIATGFPDSWFRGHSKVYEKLTPKVFRKEYIEIIQAEFRMINDFKRGAPALYEKLPDSNDYTAWLFLMQHYGTPTRLLDWSESALIALYFVVSDIEAQDDDGELWAMNPYELNGKILMTNGMPNINEKHVQFLVREPFGENNYTDLMSELDIYNVPNQPIAIEPPMNFPRMRAQLSTFTLHPKSNRNKEIEEILTKENQLVRYIVPAKNKEKMQKDLLACGITHHVLFPNLDSLSRSILEKIKKKGYTPPQPPICGGEYNDK